MALFRKTPEDDKAADEFTAPTQQDKLIEWAEKRRKRGRARMPEQQMKLNLAYVIGEQWLVWDPDRRQYQRSTPRTDDPNAPVRITANRLGTVVEHLISRLMSQAPDPQTRAAGDEDKDRDGAKVGTRILRSELRRLDWEAWRLRHYFWPAINGWAYAQIMWDPSNGAEVGKINTGQPDEQAVHMGNVTLESVPAFELAVDPDALDMRSARWCVRTRALSREAIWEQYGKVPSGGTPMRSLSDEVYSLISTNNGAHEQHVENLAVHQFWMLPCRSAPEGLVLTYCGDTILEDRAPFPYKHGRLPYVQWDFLPGVGRREGRTPVDDLVPLQADYNDARSREATIRRTLTPKILAAAGEMDQDRISSRVEVLNYNPGIGNGPKMFVPDSGWMAQYESGMNRVQAEMADRAGESQFNLSRASAAAVMSVQQINDIKAYTTQQLLCHAIEETGWHILELCKQFWAEDRVVATYSEIGQIEVAHFSAANLTGQIDVWVDSEAGAPQSKAEVTQLAFELWKAQIITDPRHLLRLISLPNTDFLTDEFNVDARQAQRENEVLMFGQQVQVNTFDNHDVHLIEHDSERKSEDYAQIMARAQAGDVDAQRIVATMDSHCDTHMQLSAAKASAAQSPTAQGKLVETMAYKDAPPDIKAQIEQQAGMEPSALWQGMAKPGGAVTPNADAFGQEAQAPGDGAAPNMQALIAQRAGIGGGLGEPGLPPGMNASQAAASMGK